MLKPNRCCVSLSLLLALSLGLAQAQAKPKAATVKADQPLSAPALRALLTPDTVWCEGWSATQADCDAVHMSQLQPDGTVLESSIFQISVRPDVTLRLYDRARLENDRICTVFRLADAEMELVMEGQVMPPEAAESFREEMAPSTEELEGKIICQRFVTTSDPDIYTEQVTVAGERRPDLESTFRVYRGNPSLKLRQPPETPELMDL
ncbi:MAG: hypothetical protein ACK41P_10115 [Asticcacaulis sp.]